MNFNIDMDSLGGALSSAQIPFELRLLGENKCEFIDSAYEELTQEQKEQVETIVANLTSE